jgi:hypothetical protein
MLILRCSFNNRDIEAAGYAPDVRAVNSALSALAQAGQWSQAINMIPGNA